MTGRNLYFQFLLMCWPTFRVSEDYHIIHKYQGNVNHIERSSPGINYYVQLQPDHLTSNYINRFKSSSADMLHIFNIPLSYVINTKNDFTK
jgi:hypothetical protein